MDRTFSFPSFSYDVYPYVKDISVAFTSDPGKWPLTKNTARSSGRAIKLHQFVEKRLLVVLLSYCLSVQIYISMPLES